MSLNFRLSCESPIEDVSESHNFILTDSLRAELLNASWGGSRISSTYRFFLLCCLSSFWWFLVSTIRLQFEMMLTYLNLVLKTQQKLKAFLLSKRFRSLEIVETPVMETIFGPNLPAEVVKCVIKIRGRQQLNNIQSRYEKFMKTLSQQSRFKMPMTVCCGQKAFIRDEQHPFDVRNHIFLSPPTFKGYPINEFNIHDYVNFWLSDQLPAQRPAWQFTMVPLSNDNILLIKVHRALLKEKLDLCELLKPLKGLHILTQEVFNEPISFYEYFRLTKWMNKPVNSIALYNDVVTWISNTYSSFIFRHDSLERHEGTHKAPESLKQLATSIVLILHNTYRQFSSQTKKSKVINLWLSLMRAESERWQLSWSGTTKVLVESLLYSPISVPKAFARLCCWLTIQWTIKLPLRILCEIETLHAFLFLNEALPEASLIGVSIKLVRYLHLIYGSLGELFSFLNLIFNAPRLIFEESKSFNSMRDIYWTLKENVN